MKMGVAGVVVVGKVGDLALVLAAADDGAVNGLGWGGAGGEHNLDLHLSDGGGCGCESFCRDT